jgi:hypothetical protein
VFSLFSFIIFLLSLIHLILLSQEAAREALKRAEEAGKHAFKPQISSLAATINRQGIYITITNAPNSTTTASSAAT